MADRIMAGKDAKPSIKERVFDIFSNGNIILKYLKYMRKQSYCNHLDTKSFTIGRIKKAYVNYMYHKLGLKLGFSIGADVFGYGLLIPHYGTIIVNGNTKVGNYSVLHTCTCIGGNPKTIGNALYLSSGAQIMGEINLGNNISIAANSLVNKSFGDNLLLAGSPATIKKNDYIPWYERDNKIFKERVNKIELLKNEMGIRI